MCGLTGWYGVAPANPEVTLRSMAAAIAHRGPDGAGFWIDRNVGLAHRRLSIIDIGTGQQPMESHDGRFTIVFNGEIYNYREIRDALLRRGHQFRTQSDTEVIVEQFRAYGYAGFSQLRGMYAFALWDAVAHCGVLARDPYGIKPLFYHKAPGTLFFGSEAKAILAATGSTGLDTHALHLLLNFRYIPGQRSLFNDVVQLPPGQVLEWTVTSQRVLNIPLPAASNEPIRNLLQTAVERHLVADVEVGCYLSGGIDSGVICALAHRLHPEKSLRSFTLPIGDDPSEADNAAHTAQQLGIVNIRGDELTSVPLDLPRMVWHLEVPKVNSWQVYALARNAVAHVKVALSGLGADELFYGYNAHSIISSLYRIPRFARFPANMTGYAISRVAGALGPEWNEPQRLGLMMSRLDDWPGAYGILRNLWDSPQLRRQIYGPRLLDENLPNAFEVLSELWPKDNDPVSALSQFEWRNKMVNDLLWQEDRMSMAVGLEVRVPYLDADFAETVRAMPREVLMRNGKRKAYFREIIADLLPPAVLDRPKSGFQIDAPKFIATEIHAVVRYWLTKERVMKHGLFNFNFIERMLARPPSKMYRWHYFLIYLMMLTHMWIEIFELGNMDLIPQQSNTWGRSEKN
jgi:asparagine synthase (glutamine-hydrolysing)